MKIITIGDTHGRTQWKEIVNKEKDADKWIFIGNYFDSRERHLNGEPEIQNFKDIIAFKKQNPDKVILLTGNHDFHYIRGLNEIYSGYQARYALYIGELVEEAIKNGYLQMCYKYDKYFFSHAGLTKTWCGTHLGNKNLVVNDVVVERINDLLVYQPNHFKFEMGDNFSQSGNDITQSPIWVRPQSLVKDMVDGVVCIVGHTNVRAIDFSMSYLNLILIDCLGDSGEYLIIDDGNLKVGK